MFNRIHTIFPGQEMAKNLMLLGRHQHTVAVIGAHHMVGIGGILVTNGWKTLRK